MENKIKFYMEQNYPIVLRELTQEDGGGWLAEIKDLPGCISDGETPQDAIANIVDAKKSWLEVAIKRGQKIPLPEDSDLSDYSGKFTLRLPKSLHRQLALASKEENVSLNQYLLSLIALNFGKKSVCAEINCKKPNPVSVYTTVIYSGEEGIADYFKKASDNFRRARNELNIPDILKLSGLSGWGSK